MKDIFQNLNHLAVCKFDLSNIPLTVKIICEGIAVFEIVRICADISLGVKHKRFMRQNQVSVNEFRPGKGCRARQFVQNIFHQLDVV